MALRRDVVVEQLLAALAQRVGFEAGATGLRRLRLDGLDDVTPAGRAHARQARQELTAYLAGRRVTFTVPVDLADLAPFPRRVLEATLRIPFGAVTSYTALVAAAGHPGAARAAGNALAANPVPVFVPCHRVIRSDGTWGPYALGPTVKTALLALERQANGRRR